MLVFNRGRPSGSWCIRRKSAAAHDATSELMHSAHRPARLALFRREQRGCQPVLPALRGSVHHWPTRRVRSLHPPLHRRNRLHIHCRHRSRHCNRCRIHNRYCIHDGRDAAVATTIVAAAIALAPPQSTGAASHRNPVPLRVPLRSRTELARSTPVACIGDAGVRRRDGQTAERRLATRAPPGRRIRSPPSTSFAQNFASSKIPPRVSRGIQSFTHTSVTPAP